MADTDSTKQPNRPAQTFPGLLNDAQKNAADRVRDGLPSADLPIIERIAETEPTRIELR
jgi:hypothetical protein